MTVFYNKRLGKVISVADGSQNMSYFGEEEEDFKSIYDFLVVPHDPFIHDNMQYMEVKDGELIFDSPYKGGKFDVR